MFAVYTYLTSTLSAVTHAPPAVTPLVLMTFGVGMTAGNLIVPLFADRALMPSAGIMLAWFAVTLALYPFASHSLPLITLDMLAIGFGVALATILQTRLVDVVGGHVSTNPVRARLTARAAAWLRGGGEEVGEACHEALL